MLKNILDYSEEEYEQKREVFMQKMQYYDDGHASEAVVDYILEHTEIKKCCQRSFHVSDWQHFYVLPGIYI